MPNSSTAIREWRQKAIFVDPQKVTMTFDETEEKVSTHARVPEDFLKKSLPNRIYDEKASLRKLSLTELLLGAGGIFCFIIYVYLKMFSIEIQGQNAISQLDTYEILSLLAGITILITLTASLLFRKLFPGEM